MIYLYQRKKVLNLPYDRSDIIKSFGFGFTISLCSKMIIMGSYKLCSDLGDIGNICLIIGGFALIVFAIGGLFDSIHKPIS